MKTPRILAALLSGTIFGFGLTLAGVLDPAVIRGFLDFFGAFDPRLGFVFAGAVLVSAGGVVLSWRQRQPAFAERFSFPAERSIDLPLIGGAALFGIGWGMVGLCPGPAIAGLVLGVPSILLFAIAMGVGMAAHEFLQRRTGDLAHAGD